MNVFIVMSLGFGDDGEVSALACLACRFEMKLLYVIPFLTAGLLATLFSLLV